MDEQKKEKIKDIIEWGYCFVIAIVLALLVRYYIGTPTIVQQTSMYPTFESGDRLILNRLYRTLKTTPKRGDIVTFEAPSVSYVSAENINLENPVAIYDNQPQGFFSKFLYYVVEAGKTSYIKRVIALPGEHIQIKDGKVYINGEELKEDYLPEGTITDSMARDGVSGGQFLDLVVPEGTVFVLGDNRANSGDSRRFGCIPYEKIEGKVVLRFWPFSKFGTI